MRKNRNWFDPTTPYAQVLAAMIAVSTVCGQEAEANAADCCAPCAPKPIICPPKCDTIQNPHMPGNCAYNAPAEINARCDGDVDFFGSASFIYWQTWVDNIAYAFVNNNPVSESLTPGIQGDYKELNFRFIPGFKVGLGANLQRDDWDGYAEYTRVHGSQSSRSDGISSPDNLAPVWATFGQPFLIELFTSGGNAYSSAAATYRNHLDFVDVEIGRKYFVGKQLVFRPAFGARGAWILQSLHVNYNYPAFNPLLLDQTNVRVAEREDVNIYQRVHSWGIGPRIGLDMDWMAGYGIRFIGSGYLDILYTRYHLQDKTSLIALAENIGINLLKPGQSSNFIEKERLSTLRAHFDTELGLGWGRYFLSNDWHIDLSATYGWQIFFSQNMFRKTFNRMVPTSFKEPLGSLFIQGLTFTARLDY